MAEENMTKDGQRRKVRRLRKGRAALFLALIILIVAGAGYAFFGGNVPQRQAAEGLVMPGKGKINILVLGVDSRDDDVGRSDTAILVTIDTITKKITELSIPRDSRVKIPGHGWDKINHAYAFGGVELSKKTVENLLGIPVDYTVKVDFKGFMRMVDILGGVTMDVEKRMHYTDPYDDNGGLHIDLRPGEQTLNGRTAIEYVRYRGLEGDIGRVARQQKFLKALLQKFTEPQMITKLPALVREFSAAVKTDMPLTEMVKLIPVVKEAAQAGLITEEVKGTPLWIDDISYWRPDIAALREEVAQSQGIPVNETYQADTRRMVDEYASSIPAGSTMEEVPSVRRQPSATEKTALKKETDKAGNQPAAAKKVAAHNKQTSPAVNKGSKSEAETTDGAAASGSAAQKKLGPGGSVKIEAKPSGDDNQ
jgi:LCP family protein required for cell wall assembly